jgi:hypothetical protein
VVAQLERLPCAPHDQGSSEVISGHQWSSVRHTISGHQWSSQAIRSQSDRNPIAIRWQSAAVTWA